MFRNLIISAAAVLIPSAAMPEALGAEADVSVAVLENWSNVFGGRRAPASILFMLATMICVIIYWMNPAGNPVVDQAMLIGIGFFIYGPIMLIGVHALDLAPKKAAGTAAGSVFRPEATARENGSGQNAALVESRY